MQKLNFLFKYKNGQFFFKNINFGDFLYYLNNHQEFLTLSNNLRNQLNTAKWNRWLYRYSLLHRKTLKNSHKITLIKKLINFNPITKNLYNKNLWASEHLKRFENNDKFFNVLSNIFFNKFLQTETDCRFTTFNTFSLNKIDNNFSNLSYYENSFFWYLKRNYTLNALNSNNIKSALSFKTSIADKNPRHTPRLKHFVLSSSAANSLSLNTLSLQLFSTCSENLLLFKNYNNSIFYENFLIKDLSLVLNDKNLLTEECLGRIFWISTQVSNLKHNLIFFDYFVSKSTSDDVVFGKFYNNSTVHHSTVNWILFIILNYDRLFINDLKYLTFF